MSVPYLASFELNSQAGGDDVAAAVGGHEPGSRKVQGGVKSTERHPPPQPRCGVGQKMNQRPGQRLMTELRLKTFYCCFPVDFLCSSKKRKISGMPSPITVPWPPPGIWKFALKFTYYEWPIRAALDFYRYPAARVGIINHSFSGLLWLSDLRWDILPHRRRSHYILKDQHLERIHMLLHTIGPQLPHRGRHVYRHYSR